MRRQKPFWLMPGLTIGARNKKALLDPVSSASRAQHLLDRDARPGRAALAEGDVGGVHLASDLVAAGKFGDHIRGLLDVVLVRKRGERLRIEQFHLGKREIRFRRTSMRDDGLEVGGKRIPCLE